MQKELGLQRIAIVGEKVNSYAEGRKCSRCGVILSIYNKESFCFKCAKVARSEMLEVRVQKIDKVEGYVTRKRPVSRTKPKPTRNGKSECIKSKPAPKNLKSIKRAIKLSERKR
jgi:ribosomal protein S27AE